jgi:hypothetical protein
MIVWFNCKITDVRLNPGSVVRYGLKDDNRFDIARYSFASFAPLEPLVSKFIFNLELADQHAGREAEMEAWLTKLFPAEKLSIHWYRCNDISQWKEIKEEIDAIDDDLIFPAGNEDHIFMDSDISIFKEALDSVSQSYNPQTVLMTSHWPESIRAVKQFNGVKQGNLVSYKIGNNDAIRVMKKKFFDWYVEVAEGSKQLMFRTEHWNNIYLPENDILVTTKEQFRHFDGYAHVGIGASYTPPLEIPPGFFDEGITVRYGFDNVDPNCVNINPQAEFLKTEDAANGVDYKWCVEDIPAFWHPFIKEIITAPSVDESAMKEARDVNLLLTSRQHFNWPHFNLSFNESNYPPVNWLNPHMLSIEFTD